MMIEEIAEELIENYINSELTFINKEIASGQATEEEIRDYVKILKLSENDEDLEDFTCDTLNDLVDAINEVIHDHLYDYVQNN